MDLYKNYLAEQFQTNWATLESGVSFKYLGPESLLIFDTVDKIVSHNDSEIVLRQSSKVKIVKTNGYGHIKILGAEEVKQAIRDFL